MKLAENDAVERLHLDGLSFFGPFISHFVRLTVLTGGSVSIARNVEGEVEGVSLYDDMEKAGSIFTRSRNAFCQLRNQQKDYSWFSEINTELNKENYLIYMARTDRLPLDRKFRHEVRAATAENLQEVAGIMKEVYSRMNAKWVFAAFDQGEKCFIVQEGKRIAGAAWLSIAGERGRMHSLAVLPQYRKQGIGRDLLFARLIWLKNIGAESIFSEIAEINLASRRIAVSCGLSVAGEMYHYHK